MVKRGGILMINKSILVGRLTKDPELRKTPNNISVVNFTVACDRYGEGADFIPCVCYKQSADYLGKYGKKGDVVALDGHITTGSYEGRNGKVYTVEVTVDRVALPRSTASKSSENPKDEWDSKKFGKTNDYGFDTNELEFY